MKEVYETPAMTVSTFEQADVISTSFCPGITCEVETPEL